MITDFTKCDALGLRAGYCPVATVAQTVQRALVSPCAAAFFFSA
jgi:hypothetical protein